MTIRTRAQLLAAITPLVDASWTDVQLTDFIDSVLLSGDTGAIRHVDKQFTHAQLIDLVANPVTVVAAPGAGLYIDPLGASGVIDTQAGAYVITDSSYPTLKLSGFWGLVPSTSNWETAGLGLISSATQIAAGFPAANTALTLGIGDNMTGGDAADTLSLRVYYRIEPAVPFGA